MNPDTDTDNKDPFPMAQPAPPASGETTLSAACCGPVPNPQSAEQDALGLPFVLGQVDTTAGPIPKVPAQLSGGDHWGSFRARLGFGRMDYALPPGLYALGDPDAEAPVLVSANYKLSFDHLRAALPGLDAWILVIDTKGINVWCAAGEGSFGTDELIGRIAATRLGEVVSHRRLILPQLGAPGVAAHTVKEHSGFRVIYGPIKATDLPAFLEAGRKATPDMRRKSFPMTERAVLIPVEMNYALKGGALLILAFLFLSGLGGPGDYWSDVARSGLLASVAVVAGILAGAVLTPLLLPYLPGRAFALKGLWAGLLAVAGLWLWKSVDGIPAAWYDRLELAAWSALVLALASFLAMNFTGASTYTGLSGVRREMKFAVPLQAITLLAAAGLWIASRVVA